jgi:colicin import membrane protein
VTALALPGLAAIEHGGAGLLPQRPGGLGLGALLALVVHFALVAALALGVSWHAAEPDAVSAELWAAVPQIAAPAAPQNEAPPPLPVPPAPPAPTPLPTPTPPLQQDADIAQERAAAKAKVAKARADAEREEQKRQLALKEQLARLAAEKALKAEKADEAQLAKQREKNLERMFGQVGASGASSATGTALRDAAPSASYAGRIRARIEPHIIFAGEVRGNPVAEVEVRCAFDGTVVGRNIVQSSGNKDWDAAVLDAIDRTATLPRDIDGRIPSVFRISFRPRI